MAPVVVRAALHLAGSHRQQRLGAVERLDLALLVDAQNQRAIRRIEIQPDDVPHLLHEHRIAGELEGLDPMRLQPEGLPDAMDGRGREADRLGHRAQAPMGRVRGRRLQRALDHFGNLVVADRARRARPRLVLQPVEPGFGKALRHLPTVCWPTPSAAAIALLILPSAASNTIRARHAKPCAVPCRRTNACSSDRSPSDNVISTALPLAILPSFWISKVWQKLIDRDTRVPQHAVQCRPAEVSLSG